MQHVLVGNSVPWIDEHVYLTMWIAFSRRDTLYVNDQWSHFSNAVSIIKT